MDSIQLKRPVMIKAIVTEGFKTNANAEIQNALQQIDLQLQQLEFQSKRAISDLEKRLMDPASGISRTQVEGLRGQVEGERNRLAGMKNELLQRMEVIKQLELGSEFVQGTVDNYVEVKKGDNLYEKMSNTEVIVKDGVIVEIRGKA